MSTCTPQAPAGLLRAKGDGNMWTFKLVPAPNMAVTFSEQDWSINGKNPVATTADNPANVSTSWGRFDGGDGKNFLSWDTPEESGVFKIHVHAKRKCGGNGLLGNEAGAAIEDTFDLDWSATVIKIKSIDIDSGATAIADGTATPENTDICAAVKKLNDKVVLKAVLDPAVAENQLPANTVTWDGGQG